MPLTLTDDSAELNFITSSDGDDLVLTAALASEPGVEFVDGLSPNALAAFTSLEELLGSNPELANAFAGITTVEEFEAALESLAPDISGAIINLTSSVGRSAMVTVLNRLVALRSGGHGVTGLAAGDPFQDVGVGVQGFGSTIDQDNRQGIAGFDADTLGVTFGADTLFSDNMRLGAAFSYSGTDVDTKGLANTLDIDSYQGTVYASYQMDQHYVDASISYGKNQYDSRRRIAVGAINSTAVGDFEADQIIIQSTYGREYNYGEDIYLSPYAGLFYANIDIDGYTETGAGALNLSVQGETHESLESVVGISVRKEMETAKGTSVVPEVHVSWRHEFLDERQVNTSTFTGGGASFTTNGFDPANNSFNVGASYSVYQENNIDIQVSYDYEAKSDYRGHSGILNIRYNFQ